MKKTHVVTRNGKPIFVHIGTEYERNECISAAIHKHTMQLQPYQRCNYEDVFNWKSTEVFLVEGLPNIEKLK